MAGAKLDRSRVARTNFTGADLSHASLYDTVGTLTFEPSADDAPNFTGADLSGARIMARLSRANMLLAKLVDARLGVDRNELKTPKRTDLSGAILVGADLTRADLTGVLLEFADLKGANLADARLVRADLAHADLTGANLAGADLTEADLDSAVLRNIRGLDTARGLEKAHNRDKVVY